MRMKVLACCAFFINTFLTGTYYAVSKGSLGRMDPIVFTFFVMVALLPLALCIIIYSWQGITREVVKSGVLLGSCICIGLFTLSVALKYNTATSTAFFPSLNGFLAAICVWIFLRQPIRKATWFAGLVSACGALLLILNSPLGGLRGALIAFIGGLFCTFYVFLADHEQRGKTAYMPLFGIQLLTMSVWGCFIALLFGNWQDIHPALPEDLWSVLYIAFGTTCLPTLITVRLQNYISPVTVSFIYILEPVLGGIFANYYLHEVLPLDGYLGGALIVAGALIHTWGTAERPASSGTQGPSLFRVRLMQAWRGSDGGLILPVLGVVAGVFVLLRLDGFPPATWKLALQLWPEVSSIVARGHGSALALVIGQAFCWLLAWMAVGGLAIISVSRLVRLLRMPGPASREKAISEQDTLEVPAMPISTKHYEIEEVSMKEAPAPAYTLEAWDERSLRQLGAAPSNVYWRPRARERLQRLEQRRQERRMGSEVANRARLRRQTIDLSAKRDDAMFDEDIPAYDRLRG
ncbi:DMT family transporter [Ktedonospora formicarum]|uniref:EamA domain-containing protein n=1 Tax=Ktedonospora formicarum TaxID=2778364 RepID=A0A8J3I3Y4_9CHLR|nr:DMT family transporter [Ktedonospora formicarum]GHO46425.1 hypothetical protein KSX_45880 [Ktedonospora formicarum]